MRIRPASGFMLGVAILLLAAGCSSDRETSRVPSAPGFGAETDPLFVRMPPRAAAVPLATYTISRRLTAAAGGELAVAGMRVRFPAGSLPFDMNVTFIVRNSEDVQVALNPPGVVLRSPAIIQLDDLTKTDGRGYHGLAFYTQSANPVQQPTSNDWQRPQTWVSTTGEFFLGGTRWDITGVQPIRYLNGDGYVTQLVTVGAGGTVVCDRIRIVVPPNALNADTYITVHQLSVDGALVAQLEPHGIQFRSPVTLEINLAGLDWQPYRDWSIYWLNENTGRWEDQGGTFQGTRVTGQLRHFSEYAPGSRGGRAGW